MLVALPAIPALIEHWESTGFGILTLAWMFDRLLRPIRYGLGRALTKLVSEHLALGKALKNAPAWRARSGPLWR
jgi:hypothetical protein